MDDGAVGITNSNNCLVECEWLWIRIRLAITIMSRSHHHAFSSFLTISGHSHHCLIIVSFLISFHCVKRGLSCILRHLSSTIHHLFNLLSINIHHSSSSSSYSHRRPFQAPTIQQRVLSSFHLWGHKERRDLHCGCSVSMFTGKWLCNGNI